jgi:hypothetical protein
MKKGKSGHRDYDQLSEWHKERVTREQWEQICREADAYLDRQPDDRWDPEPVLTLAEVEAAGQEAVAAHMRETGAERFSRSDFLRRKFPKGVPLPWFEEMEAELPAPFQHKQRYISSKLPRDVHPDFHQDDYSEGVW